MGQLLLYSCTTEQTHTVQMYIYYGSSVQSLLSLPRTDLMGALAVRYSDGSMSQVDAVMAHHSAHHRIIIRGDTSMEHQEDDPIKDVSCNHHIVGRVAGKILSVSCSGGCRSGT